MDTKPSRFDPRKCLQAIAAIETDLQRLTANLTEAQFQAPPRTGGWSIGYCIEHLTLSGNSFLQEWAAALKGAEANGSQDNGGFSYSWLERRILEFAGPPYALKIKAAKPLETCSRRS